MLVLTLSEAILSETYRRPSQWLENLALMIGFRNGYAVAASSAKKKRAHCCAIGDPSILCSALDKPFLGMQNLQQKYAMEAVSKLIRFL